MFVFRKVAENGIARVAESSVVENRVAESSLVESKVVESTVAGVAESRPRVGV